MCHSVSTLSRDECDHAHKRAIPLLLISGREQQFFEEQDGTAATAVSVSDAQDASDLASEFIVFCVTACMDARLKPSPKPCRAQA